MILGPQESLLYLRALLESKPIIVLVFLRRNIQIQVYFELESKEKVKVKFDHF